MSEDGIRNRRFLYFFPLISYGGVCDYNYILGRDNEKLEACFLYAGLFGFLHQG